MNFLVRFEMVPGQVEVVAARLLARGFRSTQDWRRNFLGRLGFVDFSLCDDAHSAKRRLPFEQVIEKFRNVRGDLPEMWNRKPEEISMT